MTWHNRPQGQRNHMTDTADDDDDFCFLDHADCHHERCLRVRDGNNTCREGHPLDDMGMCNICDDVLAALARNYLRGMSEDGAAH